MAFKFSSLLKLNLVLLEVRHHHTSLLILNAKIAHLLRAIVKTFPFYTVPFQISCCQFQRKI